MSGTEPTTTVQRTLCSYTRVNLIYIADDIKMNQKPPRGNETVYKFKSAKIKQYNATYQRIKICNNKKVWAASIEDVEWITVEVMNNAGKIDMLTRKVDELIQQNSKWFSTREISKSKEKRTSR